MAPMPDRSLLSAVPASDIDEDLAEIVPTAAGRRIRPKFQRRHFIMGAAGLVGAALLGAVLLKPSAPAKAEVGAPLEALEHKAAKKAKKGGGDDDEEAAASPEGIGKYKQCGGQGWTPSVGATACCQKGCACIIHTKYYSQCDTPTDATTGSPLTDCDADAAKSEAKRAANRAKAAKAKVAPALKVAKEAAAAAEKAEEEAKKAHEPLDELVKDGKKARDANAKAQPKAKHLRKLADEAEEAATKAGKAYNDTMGQLAVFLKAEKLREAGKCGKLYGSCTASSCCEDGCMCKWKNPSYAQCVPPTSHGACDATAENKKIKDMKESVVDLKEKAETTAKKMKETAKAAKEAEEDAEEKKKAAVAAGTKRVKGQHFAAHKAAHAKKMKKASDDAQKAALHAKHAIKYKAAMVGVWEKVAKGDHCHKVDADHVVAEI